VLHQPTHHSAGACMMRKSSTQHAGLLFAMPARYKLCEEDDSASSVLSGQRPVSHKPLRAQHSASPGNSPAV
jgi:hypothetical protein